MNSTRRASFRSTWSSTASQNIKFWMGWTNSSIHLKTVSVRGWTWALEEGLSSCPRVSAQVPDKSIWQAQCGSLLLGVILEWTLHWSKETGDTQRGRKRRKIGKSPVRGFCARKNIKGSEGELGKLVGGGRGQRGRLGWCCSGVGKSQVQLHMLALQYHKVVLLWALSSLPYSLLKESAEEPGKKKETSTRVAPETKKRGPIEWENWIPTQQCICTANSNSNTSASWQKISKLKVCKPELLFWR